MMSLHDDCSVALILPLPPHHMSATKILDRSGVDGTDKEGQTPKVDALALERTALKQRAETVLSTEQDPVVQREALLRILDEAIGLNDKLLTVLRELEHGLTKAETNHEAILRQGPSQDGVKKVRRPRTSVPATADQESDSTPITPPRTTKQPATPVENEAARLQREIEEMERLIAQAEGK